MEKRLGIVNGKIKSVSECSVVSKKRKCKVRCSSYHVNFISLTVVSDANKERGADATLAANVSVDSVDGDDCDPSVNIVVILYLWF